MNKKIICFLISIIVYPALNAANTLPDSVFSAANKFYIEKKYDKAVETYNILIDKGHKTAGLFFNIGNAYFKAGNYAKAILFYERAKLLAPSDADIDFNLAKAKTYVIDKIEVIPDFFIKAWFKSVIAIFSPNQWAGISVILFVLFTICALIYLLIIKPALKRLSFYLGFSALIIAFLALFFAFKTRQYIENSMGAIVMSPTVTVKSSPDNESTNVFIIHEGTKVFIVRSLDGWDEIKLTDGKQGWLESSTIEKI
ncbi:MAG: tetratricopeptide repeat protein [Bacteroidales bacterium]|nr:tetratricopeptide repeat protein [Bacteroidales bacterium]